MRPRTVSRLLLLSLVVLSAACDRPAQRRTAAERAAAARLTGVWQLRLALEATPSADSSRATPRAAQGTLSFIESAVGDDGARLGASPTHSGTYDLVTEPLGFVLRAPNPVPALVAAVLSSDSIGIVLPAGADDGVLVLRGRLTANSVEGRWRYEARAAGGWMGTFTLRHEQGSTPP